MKTASKVHAAFDAKDIKAIKATNLDVAKHYDLLHGLGIGIDEKVLADMMSFAMDSIQNGLTTASMATPVQFAQAWLPGLVEILTAARKADLLVGMQTVGDWKDEQVVVEVLENTAYVTEYGDLTNIPLSSWNLNFVTRSIVRFEGGIRVGLLEEARAAAARVSSAEVKRQSAALGLEQLRNAIAFYGYNNGNNNTYGFLNDPNLPSYAQVATGVGGYLWSQKTFSEIIADILSAIVKLRTQTADAIDPKRTPLTLALPTAVVDRLAVVSPQYGAISVWDWLKTNYPNIRVESAPQLNSAYSSSNVFYLFADKVEGSTDGGATFVQPVPTKFNMLGVQKLVKGYEEGYTNATAGVICKRPIAVVRYYGV